MANIDHSLSKRLNDAAARYQSHAGERHRAERILQGKDWDWRKIETPTRVLRRMQALGLESLAGEIMSGVTAPESIRRPHVQVGLLERILEENDLLSSRFLHLGSQFAESVCKIVIRRSGRILGSGTGFMISPRLLMTNNHVLENKMNTRDSTLIFDYYQRRSGITGPTLEFRLEPETFFMTDQALDYTVVAVAETSPQRVPIASRGYIPLIVESGKVLIGEPVNIIQHPSGGPQQIAIYYASHLGSRCRYPDCDAWLRLSDSGWSGCNSGFKFFLDWTLVTTAHDGKRLH